MHVINVYAHAYVLYTNMLTMHTYYINAAHTYVFTNLLFGLLLGQIHNV